MAQIPRAQRKGSQRGQKTGKSATSAASLRKSASETGHLIARNEPLWRRVQGIQHSLQQIKDQPRISVYNVAVRAACKMSLAAGCVPAARLVPGPSRTEPVQSVQEANCLLII